MFNLLHLVPSENLILNLISSQITFLGCHPTSINIGFLFVKLPRYAVEHGHAKVGCSKVDKEVVGQTPHSTMGKHGPKHQGVTEDGGDEDDRECGRPDNVLHIPCVQNGQHPPEYENTDRCHHYN